MEHEFRDWVTLLTWDKATWDQAVKLEEAKGSSSKTGELLAADAGEKNANKQRIPRRSGLRETGLPLEERRRLGADGEGSGRQRRHFELPQEQASLWEAADGGGVSLALESSSESVRSPQRRPPKGSRLAEVLGDAVASAVGVSDAMADGGSQRGPRGD